MHVAGLTVIAAAGSGFDWGEVGKYLFDRDILQGALITVVMAVLSQFTGTLIGLLLYLMRRSNFLPIRWFAELYIWFFRGTPLLVQLELLFLSFSEFHLVRPIRQIDFFPSLGFDRIVLEAVLPALIAFSLNEGAYMAEIVRAGIDSIDVGQMEAAKSLGMTYGLAMRRIILPQAARVIIPPLGNEFNNMLKNISLASVIGLYELLRVAEAYGFTDFKPVEVVITASIWYLAMTTVWGFIQSYMERRLNASNTPIQPPSLMQRMFSGWRPKPVNTTAEAIAEIGQH